MQCNERVEDHGNRTISICRGLFWFWFATELARKQTTIVIMKQPAIYMQVTMLYIPLR